MLHAKSPSRWTVGSVDRQSQSGELGRQYEIDVESKMPQSPTSAEHVEDDWSGAEIVLVRAAAT